MLCTASLEPLFATDLKGCPVGMCLDLCQLYAYTYNRLGYPQEEGYFNSGVILYNLDLWRRENLSVAMFEWLKINAKRITMHDQDTINAVLHGKIFPLDLSYNVIGSQFYVYYWLQEEKNGYYAHETQTLPKSEWPAVLAAVEAPRLVHITSKPWFKDSRAPFDPVWRYFYSRSPWRGERLKRRKLNLPPKAKIKWLGRRALERLNLIAPAIPPCPQEVYKVGQRLLEELMNQ